MPTASVQDRHRRGRGASAGVAGQAGERARRPERQPADREHACQDRKCRKRRAGRAQHVGGEVPGGAEQGEVGHRVHRSAEAGVGDQVARLERGGGGQQYRR
ncbi:MAG: hypothetical protein U5L06_01925 [Rhodovibrio sp.]|nr:hypothetical protein [Rhodovibrio sp.]